MTRFLNGKREKPGRRYRGFLDTMNHHIQNVSLFHAEITTRGKPRKLQKPDLYKQLYNNTDEGMQVLAQVFDEFVRDCDAAGPFDKHLLLQVPRKILSITSQTGTFLPLDSMFDMEGGVEQQIHVLFSQIRYFDSTIWMPNITGFLTGKSSTERRKAGWTIFAKRQSKKSAS